MSSVGGDETGAAGIEPGRALRERRTRVHCVLGRFALVFLLFFAALATSARAAETLGEIEEPGQVERRPIGESADETRESGAPTAEEARSDQDGSTKDSDKEEEPHPKEATAILPDSEAVDPTIDEVEAAPSAPSSDHPEAAGADRKASTEDSDEELHPDEATAILPDSEAVDESIDEGEAPVAEDEASEAPGPATPPSEPQWSIRWQNAFIVQRVDDPSYQFLFGGRIQTDWGVYAPDNDLEDAFGDDGTGTKFRRARLYFQGQFFRYGFFKAEYDFAEGSGTEFTDVYMGLNLPNIGLLRLGRFKEPFSLEFQSSSNFLSFNERSGAFALTPGRNSGVMLNGNFLARDSTFSVAFMRRTDEIGQGFSSKEDYHLTVRLTGLPYFEEGGQRLLHLELGYSHQFADEDIGTRYQQGAANDFAPTLVDTGELGVSDVDLFNAGFALIEGALSFQSEVTVSLPHNGISENPVFWGTYAELSWWPTGENRRYLRGRGVFSRVVPKSRFDPTKGRWGAVELATRLSWLDLSNDGIRGGTLGEWSLAINWVLFSNLRMSNNYVFSHTSDRAGTRSGNAHSLVTRFQVDF